MPRAARATDDVADRVLSFRAVRAAMPTADWSVPSGPESFVPQATTVASIAACIAAVSAAGTPRRMRGRSECIGASP